MASATTVDVLLVGATGMLGGSILEGLLETNQTVRALLRPGKEAVERSLSERGVEVAHGDVLDRASVDAAVTGARVVVIALNNNPDLFVPGHRNLLEAAESHDVERIVPSDFSVDFFKIRPDENDNLAMRHEVAPLFEGTRVRPIHVLIGAFMDTMLDPNAPFIDWERGNLPFFGDGEQLCDFTTVADAGRFVAAACADRDAPEAVRFAGDVLTMPGLAASVAAGRGITLEGRRQGSVDDLAGVIESKKHSGGDPWEWIALQYHHNMVSGRAKLEPLNNERYPDVQPETIEDFARHTKDETVRGMGFSN
ncbi:MAG: NmrA family NAD(P)-binding protein [Planctomycetota bacterium]